jgi:hypothetical protein
MGSCGSKLELTLTTIAEILRAIENGDHRIALILLEQASTNLSRYSRADRVKIQELSARISPE